MQGSGAVGELSKKIQNIQFYTIYIDFFSSEDNDLERFREIYDDFYKMGMEARRLKNMYGVNGTVILLDSTLSSINPINWSGAHPGPNYNVNIHKDDN